jgi:hypothetical protein
MSSVPPFLKFERLIDTWLNVRSQRRVDHLEGQPKCQATLGALIADLVADANLAGLFARVRSSLASGLLTLDVIPKALCGGEGGIRTTADC